MEEKKFEKLDTEKYYSFQSKYHGNNIGAIISILIAIIIIGLMFFGTGMFYALTPTTAGNHIGANTLFIIGSVFEIIFLILAILNIYYEIEFKVKTRLILKNGRITTGNIQAMEYLGIKQRQYKHKVTYAYVDENGVKQTDFYHLYYRKQTGLPEDKELTVIFYNGLSMRLDSYAPLEE